MTSLLTSEIPILVLLDAFSVLSSILSHTTEHKYYLTEKKGISLWSPFIGIIFPTTKGSLERACTAVIWIGLWGLFLLRNDSQFYKTVIQFLCMKLYWTRAVKEFDGRTFFLFILPHLCSFSLPHPCFKVLYYRLLFWKYLETSAA